MTTSPIRTTRRIVGLGVHTVSCADCGRALYQVDVRCSRVNHQTEQLIIDAMLGASYARADHHHCRRNPWKTTN